MCTMKKVIRFLMAFLLLFLTLPLWAINMGNTIPPFEVLSQDEEPLTEKDLLGKITVLFYDNRRTAAVNNDLKYEISDFREQNLPLLENLQVVQVVDASSANFLTRTIWKRKLRENARKYGVDLYADWNGAMRQSFGFDTKESNVLVVDPRGMVRYALLGKVATSEKEKLLILLLAIGEESEKQKRAQTKEVTIP
ncbi:MAG: YtfJ family protein [Atribacterota bacterium]